MTSLPWLTGMAVEIAWPALLVVGLIGGLGCVPVLRGRAPRTLAVLGMLTGPGVMLLYAAAMFGRSHAGPGEFDLVQYGHLGLTALAIAWIGRSAWRERQVEWWWLAPASAIGALVVVAVTWFTGAMALVDDWL